MGKENDVVPTNFADSIHITEGTASYDKAAKKLLANKCILAWILSSCAPEFEGHSVTEVQTCIEGTPEISVKAVHRDAPDADESIIGDNTEDGSIREGTIYYDVRFTATVPGTEDAVQIFVNVEVQRDSASGYPLEKRVIYYLSRMISAQYGTVFTHSQYGKIRKVYSVWVLPKPPIYRRNSIFKMSFQGEDVAGDFHSKQADVDLMTGIILSLSDDREASSDNMLLRLLDVLLSTTRGAQEKKEIMEKEYRIPYTKSFESEVSEMCNLGEGIYLDGKQARSYEVADRMIAKGKKYSDAEISELTDLSLEEISERREQKGQLQPA